MAERLLLVGMMGAGKSTVARLAACRLRWACVDTDEEVTRATGSSVADVFARRGEPFFRAQEARALAAALERPEPLVVSVGGGAVLDPANRALMRSAGTVVWLRARPETLAARVGDGGGRPLLAGNDDDPTTAIRRIDDERRTLYEEVADVIVDVDDLEAATVADSLLARTGLRASDPAVRR